MGWSPRFNVIVVMIAVLALAAGCQALTGRSAGRYLDDKTITAEVKAKLVADKISNLTRVGVSTVNGTVYLDGVVESDEQKAGAEQLARRVDGVQGIVNNIQVRPRSMTR